MAAQQPQEIALSIAEAEEILSEAMRIAGGMQPDGVMRLQALAGTCNIVTAMQRIGWRVARPLKAVGS